MVGLTFVSFERTMAFYGDRPLNRASIQVAGEPLRAIIEERR